MSTHRVIERKEDELRNYFYKKENFTVHFDNHQPKSDFTITAKEVPLPFFCDYDDANTVFGIKPVVSGQKIVRFDLIAKPFFKSNDIVVIELKVRKVVLNNIYQLLGYVSILRHMQKSGGEGGLGFLSRKLKCQVTMNTNIRGLLIGKQISPGLLLWVPEETWKYISFCIYKLNKDPKTNMIKNIDIYDKSHSFKTYCYMMGKKFNEACNY